MCFLCDMAWFFFEKRCRELNSCSDIIKHWCYLKSVICRRSKVPVLYTAQWYYIWFVKHIKNGLLYFLCHWVPAEQLFDYLFFITFDPIAFCAYLVREQININAICIKVCPVKWIVWFKQQFATIKQPTFPSCNHICSVHFIRSTV